MLRKLPCQLLQKIFSRYTLYDIFLFIYCAQFFNITYKCCIFKYLSMCIGAVKRCKLFKNSYSYNLKKNRNFFYIQTPNLL